MLNDVDTLSKKWVVTRMWFMFCWDRNSKRKRHTRNHPFSNL